MLIFAIDDEKSALELLSSAIAEAVPEAEIMSFNKSSDALNSIIEDKKYPDIVFSDIRMPGVDGLELAVKIKNNAPDTKIVFVTGYSDYAVDAFKIHANGYIMKPVAKEDILSELDNLNINLDYEKEKLCVRCFGKFEVFYNGVPVRFKRLQTKELFAFLIDQNGASSTAEEAASAIWENEIDMQKAKHRLRNLVNDLRSTLKELGKEDVIIKTGRTIAVNKSLVDCDYYRMLDGDMDAVNSYRGEYMNQYSWAQFTTGKLYFN